MKRAVVWSHVARAEYLNVIRYIAADDPDAAARVADRVEAAGALLADFATGRAGRVHGTYEKVVSVLPYILAYEIVTHPDGAETVAILHVLHGARDWPPGRWPEG